MIRPETLHLVSEAEPCLVYIILVLLTTELGRPGDVNWSSNSLMLESPIQNLLKPMKISFLVSEWGQIRNSGLYLAFM